MTNHEEWNAFLGNLMSNALEEYKNTKESDYRVKQEKQIDTLLGERLTPEQKGVVEDCLFEIGLAAERETSLMYERGMRDCVWLLKNLGVLA